MIRNIWAVGRNYKKHAAELGNDLPTTPLMFLKAGSCIQTSTTELIFAEGIANIHYEAELAIQLDDQLQPTKAAIAVDFTARDLQEKLKTKGHPWTLAKSFSGACALSSIHPFEIANAENTEFELMINSDKRQHGKLKDMIFDLPTIVAYVKHHFPVCPNDLILTGTPEGVGAIRNGDQLQVRSNFGVEQSWKIHQPQVRP